MKPEYPFLRRAGRILNSNQTRTILLTGDIHDLYQLDDEYVPLINFLSNRWNVRNRILMVYELNGPIRFVRSGDREKVRDAWLAWRTGFDADHLAVESMIRHSKTRYELESMSREFDTNLMNAVGNPTVALELLRQFSLCSRSGTNGIPILEENLIIIIEAADMVIPEGEISRLSDADRRRISICQDWFSDPGFMQSADSVVLLSESTSLINHRVARLPQIIEVNIPAPDFSQRLALIHWFESRLESGKKLNLWSSSEVLAKFTASLSIHALMQLLKAATYESRQLTLTDVIGKVEKYIQSQLGEDVVEFKKPDHTFDDLVGFSNLKSFLKTELIPRFRSTGPEALPGAAVCGPIGSGKTFIFEAVAGELDMIVLVLKNIRSQWFGQTDVIFERLRRVLDALAKVLIFVDEADTQFGGVGAETHSTERRLTGKIQAMMSDPKLRGKVIWLLMTARINLLSPDIRRPGRVGDLIIPVLDPDGKDRREFLKWMIRPALKRVPTKKQMERLESMLHNYSAAGFASIRSELKARVAMKGSELTFRELMKILDDHIPPAIGDARRYQTLQALINCTRKSLLPPALRDAALRKKWETELRKLESRGVK